eukprot:6162972-Pyramimonas_sp.AAC.3
MVERRQVIAAPAQSCPRRSRRRERDRARAPKSAVVSLRGSGRRRARGARRPAFPPRYQLHFYQGARKVLKLPGQKFKQLPAPPRRAQGGRGDDGPPSPVTTVFRESPSLSWQPAAT